MSLKNYTLKYLSIALLAVIGIWAAIFYVNMIDEVYDSIDDGLDNYKMLIIKKAHEDSTLVNKTTFSESNYSITPLNKEQALSMRDSYKDTLMYMFNEEDYEPVRLLSTAFTLNNRYYELRVISSMVEEDDLVEDLMYSILWLYVALILSIVIINNLLLKKIWKPFYEILDHLKNFRIHEPQKRDLSPTKITEFKLLDEAVQQMIQHATDAYINQKQFIENASHELQTPLAISINKLELLAEKEQQQTSAAELSAVIESLERLTRLNKSLLLLSKIENKQFNQVERIHINPLVTQLVEDFENFASFKQVNIAVSMQEELYANMDKGLLSVLLTNLLKNAITHTSAGGRVEMTLDKNTFSISNTAANGALNGEKIFERFYKDASEKANTGLGLSIVKAVCALYNIRISYSFEHMHRFTLLFPAA